MRRVSITLAMFLNNAMCCYYFGDVSKQCDMFLSLWQYFEAMRRVSITLAICYRIKFKPIIVHRPSDECTLHGSKDHPNDGNTSNCFKTSLR